MSTYTRETASLFIRTEGLDHYLGRATAAKAYSCSRPPGRVGAVELLPLAGGLPMGMVIRRLDNPLVDSLVNSIRCQHGNRVLHKDDFARGLIGAMRAGETVGILMDTNMTPPQGLFVPSSASRHVRPPAGAGRAQTGAARPARLPAVEEPERQYVLRFGPELTLADSATRRPTRLEHRSVYRGDRRDNPAIPLAVAVDAPPLEDPPSRRTTLY